MSYGFTGFIVRLCARRIWRFVEIGHVETWEGASRMTCKFRFAKWVYRPSVIQAKRMTLNIECRRIRPYRKLFENAGYVLR